MRLLKLIALSILIALPIGFGIAYLRAPSLEVKATIIDENSPKAIFNNAHKLWDTGNYAQAITLYDKAAAEDYVPALVELGHLYARANEIEKDWLKSKQYLHRALELDPDDNFTLKTLGYAYHKTGDKKQAIEYYIKVAPAGDSTLNYYLATQYETGQHVEQNFYKALKYYNIAAENGHDEGFYRMGRIYENKDFPERNVRKAFDYYTKAIATGSTGAKYSIGRLYIIDDGIPVDEEKAFYWMNEAAKDKHPFAVNAISHYYLKKDATRQDLDKAGRLIAEATSLGHVSDDVINEDHLKYCVVMPKSAGPEDILKTCITSALEDISLPHYILANFYLNGWLVQPDALTAKRYFTHAAKLGHSEAQKVMITYYEKGRIPPLSSSAPRPWVKNLTATRNMTEKERRALNATDDNLMSVKTNRTTPKTKPNYEVGIEKREFYQ